MVFFWVSLLPVFWTVFIGGIGHDTEDSRFLYFPALAFIALMVLGLLEFGWKSWIWKTIAIAALLVMMQTYYRAAEDNSVLWGHYADIIAGIPPQTKSLLPEPDPGAKLYLENVPKQIGTWYYGSGLERAVGIAYGRSDLQIELIDGNPDPAELNDGYLFFYHDQTRVLEFIRPPRSGA